MIPIIRIIYHLPRTIIEFHFHIDRFDRFLFLIDRFDRYLYIEIDHFSNQIIPQNSLRIYGGKK